MDPVQASNCIAHCISHRSTAVSYEEQHHNQTSYLNNKRTKVENTILNHRHNPKKTRINHKNPKNNKYNQQTNKKRRISKYLGEIAMGKKKIVPSDCITPWELGGNSIPRSGRIIFQSLTRIRASSDKNDKHIWKIRIENTENIKINWSWWKTLKEVSIRYTHNLHSKNNKK